MPKSVHHLANVFSAEEDTKHGGLAGLVRCTESDSAGRECGLAIVVNFRWKLTTYIRLRHPQSSEAMLRIAFISILLNRLTK